MKTYEQELDGSSGTVLREADALYEGHGRLQKTYERLSRRLEELDISHCLIGGFAVFLHGLRRFTEDIDILVSADGLTGLRGELLGRGYAQVSGSAKSIRDTETRVRIDFVVSGDYPGDGKPKPVAFPDPGSNVETREGIRLVDFKTLIELKLASGMTSEGRLQDLADVQRLIQIHKLTKDFAEKLQPYVRDKFQELCGD